MLKCIRRVVKILLQICWSYWQKKTTAQCVHLLMVAWSAVKFLHNTKIVDYDKFQQEEQDNKWNCKHLKGTFINVNEVWHYILKYPEVSTNMNFVMIQTTWLETRTGNSLRNHDNQANRHFTQFDACVTNNYEK